MRKTTGSRRERERGKVVVWGFWIRTGAGITIAIEECGIYAIRSMDSKSMCANGCEIAAKRKRKFKDR